MKAAISRTICQVGNLLAVDKTDREAGLAQGPGSRRKPGHARRLHHPEHPFVRPAPAHGTVQQFLQVARCGLSGKHRGQGLPRSSASTACWWPVRARSNLMMRTTYPLLDGRMAFFTQGPLSAPAI